MWRIKMQRNNIGLACKQSKQKSFIGTSDNLNKLATGNTNIMVKQNYRNSYQNRKKHLTTPWKLKTYRNLGIINN